MSKDKCSFCLTEDEGIQYFANNDNTACICENCAHLFTNYLASQSLSNAPNSDVVISVKNYFVIRIGVIGATSSGDFIENILPELSLIVITDDDENLLIHNSLLGLLNYKDQFFSDIIEDVVARLPSPVDPQLLAGLYTSIFEQNTDGLINFSEGLEEKIYDANESEDVENYPNSLFGIGSVSRDTGATISSLSGRVTFEGDEIEDASGFYGYVDEDESWVIGIRT